MKSELTQRIISGSLLAAAVLFITYWHPISFTVMCLWGSWILWKEWRALTRNRSRIFFPMGIAYISTAIASLIALRYSDNGAMAIYRLFALVWAIDIGGYVVGKLIGKHKIAPSISPGKSWEGLLGSVLFSALSLYLINYYTLQANSSVSGNSNAQNAMHLYGIIFPLVIGVIFSIIGLLGDLFESSLKRRAGVKDSGTLIPGHGGLFDRVDALMPIAIVIGITMGAGALLRAVQ